VYARGVSEIAVLKVLGFRPVQILGLVLGEAVLIGALSGLFSSLFVYQAINRLVDNSASFLPVYVPKEALWWGGGIGALAAVAGSLLPAWLACRTKVSDVFARIA
jgi:putative ABC transport system permease protein